MDTTPVLGLPASYAGGSLVMGRLLRGARVGTPHDFGAGSGRRREPPARSAAPAGGVLPDRRVPRLVRPGCRTQLAASLFLLLPCRSGAMVRRPRAPSLRGASVAVPAAGERAPSRDGLRRADLTA